MARRLFSHVVSPLLLGGMLYVLFRPDSLTMFRWFEWMGWMDFIQSARSAVPIDLADWVIYSLPNGLWVYALMNMVILIWGHRVNGMNLVWFLFPVVLGVGSELGQYGGILAGTFDFTDLLFCLAASLAPFILFRQKAQQHTQNLPHLIRHSLTVVGCAVFMILAVGSNGPADAVQDLYIQTEQDSVKKEKMRRKEDFYHQHYRTEPTQAQQDSIDADVDAKMKRAPSQ